MLKELQFAQSYFFHNDICVVKLFNGYNKKHANEEVNFNLNK